MSDSESNSESESNPPNSSQPRILGDRDLSILFVKNEIYKIDDRQASLSVNDYIDQLYGKFDREQISRRKARRNRYFDDDDDDYMDPDQKQDYILSQWNVAHAFGAAVHDIIDRVLMRQLADPKIKFIKGEVKTEKEEPIDGETASGSGILVPGLLIKIKKEKDVEEEAAAGGSSVPDCVIKQEPSEDQENELKTNVKTKKGAAEESNVVQATTNRVLKRKLSNGPETCKFPKMEAVKIKKGEGEEKEIEPILQSPKPLPDEQLLPVVPDKPVADIVREIIGEHYSDTILRQIIEKCAEMDVDEETFDELIDECLPDFRSRLKFAITPIVDLMQIIGAYSVCATNYMVWDSDFKRGTIAGTIDCLLWKCYEKQEVIVVDWTTKKSLDYPSLVKARGSPFHGHNRTKLEKCFCQLHLFGQILEKCYNVKVVETWVVQIDDNELEIQKDTVSYERCPCSK